MFPLIKIINTFTKICLVYISSNLKNQSYNNDVHCNINNNIALNNINSININKYNNSNKYIPPKNFYLNDKKIYKIDYIFLLD